jgi:ABC-type transport system involved in multi-copper enzyme maturation permease subunit
MLRRLAQSTTSFRSAIFQKLGLSKGDRTRKPRGVWINPIAWREAKTKGSAARATLLRYSFVGLGLLGAMTLVIMHSTTGVAKLYIDRGALNDDRQTLYIQSDDHKYDSDELLARAEILKVKLNGNDAGPEILRDKYAVSNVIRGPRPGVRAPRTGIPQQQINEIDLVDYPRLLVANDARQWLLGAVMLEFAVILLVVTNAAASTVTREKEDGTLDLLLSSPITSRYYIWGKLRGLVAFVVPFIAVPVASVLIFVVHDMARWLFYGDHNFDWVCQPEALLIMPGTLIIVCAVAAILGMQMSLRCRTTVRAVMSSVGIIAGTCAALGWCGAKLIDQHSFDDSLNVAISSFSPFTLLALLIDPVGFGGHAFDPAFGNAGFARVLVMVIAIIAMAAYSLGVWQMYKSMVKNFDMTIRKQSR